MAKIGKTSLELVQGDITDMDCDAIVNAANTDLVLGGGVAGAIRRKGGPAIQEECSKIGRIKVGETEITTGGSLKAKYVIHSVGPKFGEGNENRKLAPATLNSIKMADRHGLRSIAFPAISTGVFGFSVDRRASVMLSTLISYFHGKTGIERIVLCSTTPIPSMSFIESSMISYESRAKIGLLFHMS